MSNKCANIRVYLIQYIYTNIIIIQDKLTNNQGQLPRQLMMKQSKQQISEQQFSEFIISIKSGAAYQVDTYLQKYGSEITNKLQTQQRQPPLYFAINLPDDQACLQMLKKLIQKGANVKYKDQNQQTIIFYACRDGKAQCIKFLTGLGVSLFEEDAYGQTPLYYIANQNHLALLDLYGKPEYYNHVDKLAQQTPLYYAAKKGYLQMCKQLIERGCDATHHDVHNKTAVEYARRARYHEVTQFLANEVKKARQFKTQQLAKQAALKQQQEARKAQRKQQMEVQRQSNVPRSFYKIVYVNEQGETKDMTEEDIRNLIRDKPALQAILANPGGIPGQLLENEKQSKEPWQKVANRVLSNVWKHKGSMWFQEPVDPVKFGIMDYNDIITHPMDLGTIKKKLSLNFYPSPTDFAEDVRLVWSNCYKYNGDEHEISTCAKDLEYLFEQHYEEQLKAYEAAN